MTRSAAWKTLFYFVLIVENGMAAEIRLKPECRCRRSLVRLGDVADIGQCDKDSAAQLAAVALLPAPPTGRTRLLRAGEVRELLVLSGLDSSDLTFRGASAVRLMGSAPASSGEPAASEIRWARQRVERAIGDYLRRAAPNASWRVAAELDANGARLLATRLSDLTVQGGRPPWTGSQEFLVSARTPQGTAQIAVRAQVALPDAVVVAARPLRPGQLLDRQDVQLLCLETPVRGLEPLRSLDEAIGKEAVRAVAAGRPIGKSQVRRPPLVRRGESVAVFARTGGVCVRTTARALEDGALDDLVTVETVEARRRLAGRVTGIQEIEIYARGPSAGGGVASRSSRRAIGAGR